MREVLSARAATRARRAGWMCAVNGERDPRYGAETLIFASEMKTRRLELHRDARGAREGATICLLSRGVDDAWKRLGFVFFISADDTPGLVSALRELRPGSYRTPCPQQDPEGGHQPGVPRGRVAP